VVDPFTQDEQSVERSGGGLGIGLNLVRNLVDLHGGRVQAFSDGPGHGSEFVIHLPVAAGKPPLSDEEPVAASSPSGFRARDILIVDDNGDSAETLAKLLRFQGHQVRTTLDGEKALAAAQERAPEVVLLDIG